MSFMFHSFTSNVVFINHKIYVFSDRASDPVVSYVGIRIISPPSSVLLARDVQYFRANRRQDNNSAFCKNWLKLRRVADNVKKLQYIQHFFFNP